MTSDLGEYLREGIERATATEQFHAGLAGRARERHHRRARTIRAATVTGTATVAAAVFAATTGTGGTPAGARLPIQTTAYVAGRTEGALAAAGKGNLIERVTSTAPPDGWRVVITMTPSRGQDELSSQKIFRTTSWTYRGQTRIQEFTPSGRLAVDVGLSTASGPGGDRPATGIIVVEVGAGQWFFSPGAPLVIHPSPPTCANVGFQLLAVGDGAAGEGAPQMSALIPKALSCHLFRATGHQRVNGVDTVRLAATPVLTRQFHENNGTTGPQAALWVNAKTFLPARMELGPGHGSTNFTWLKPTKANLRVLSVKVPAGAHEKQLPTWSTVLWTVTPKGTR